MIDKSTSELTNNHPRHQNAVLTKIMKDPAPLATKDDKYTWYRIKFSCQHCGRYVASTKRRITWQFGSISRVKSGLDEYEEHEVVLVWSLKSGKKRLHWNGKDYSRLFEEAGNQKPPSANIELVWESARGVSFKAVAHEKSAIAIHQYDFFINGTSIMSTPSKFSAIKCREEEAKHDALHKLCEPAPNDVTLSMENIESIDLVGSGGELSADAEDHLNREACPASSGYTFVYDMEDELRSDLYSSTLDTLRHKVSAMVPETEEMVSRAILNAYSEDHDSDTSVDSLDSDKQLDPAEVEADVFAETFAYLKWAKDFIAANEIVDRKLEFMQKHVEQMVAHVRHERLKPSAACNIMHRIAAILKLGVAKDPAHDTIMFEKLNSLTTADDLVIAMRKYGDTAVAAVSKHHEGFGFCRFVSRSAVRRVCESAKTGGVEVNGRRPFVFPVFDSPYVDAIQARIMDCRDKEEIFDESENLDCIEATYATRGRGSLNLSHLQEFRYSQRSLQSSTQRYVHQRPSYKSSPGSLTTLSTLDVEEFETNNLIPMSVLD